MASKRTGILWVKGLEDRKEIGALGRRLNLDPRIVCCLCMRFWAWADDHTEDGSIPDTTIDFVDSNVGQPGFCAAMVSVGWLEIDSDGIRLPRWNKYRASSFLKRQLATIRQARRRAKRAASATHALQERDTSVTETTSKNDKNRLNNQETRDISATRSATHALQERDTSVTEKTSKHSKTAEKCCEKKPDKPSVAGSKVVGGVGGGARATLQGQPKDESAQADSERDQTLREQVEDVFAHYRTYHPQAHRIPLNAANEWRAVSARLKEGFSVADLKSAIDGCHRCPHNQGHNERGMKYLGLELICRNGSQVTRFMEIPENAMSVPHLSEKTLETLRGANGYVSQRQSGGTNDVH